MKISAILLGTLVVFVGTQYQCKQKEQVENQTAPLQLVPFGNSPEFSDASIAAMEYRDGMFKFQITGAYKLGEQTSDAPAKSCANSNQGQHIHLIVDNKPYEAKYEPDFKYIVPDGDHYILAFLSRSYHESIKSTKASVLIHATIKDSSFKAVSPVTQPMLFYSRPKGTYVGNDAQNILVDFYLANCALGDSLKVKAEVADTSFLIDQWRPYTLQGLPMGEHTLKLSLIDGAGNLVQTPLNPVERKFTLQAEPGK